MFLRKIKRIHLLATGFIFSSFVLFTQVSAAEFTVSNVDELRSAIQEANLSIDQDIITLNSGTYLLSGVAGENDAFFGDLDLKGNLILQGQDANTTILEGGGQDRVLHVIGDVNVTVKNITIRKGQVFDQDGAGILNEGVAGSVLTLENCTISENKNQTNSNFFSGGGIKNLNGQLVIKSSTISGNDSGTSGGGISNEAGNVSISNSTISGNFSQVGGGIFNQVPNGNLSIVNSTITSNEVEESGGGISTNNDTTVTIRNSIIAENIDNSLTKPDCSGANGTFISEGYNLIGNTNGCDITPATGDQIGTDANPIDPLLGPLQDNGGNTDTHALLDGSPAFESGDPNCTGDDQRGVSRPQGDVCDIGSFEKEISDPDNNSGNGSSGGCSFSGMSSGAANLGFILLGLALGALGVVRKVSR